MLCCSGPFCGGDRDGERSGFAFGSAVESVLRIAGGPPASFAITEPAELDSRWLVVWQRGSSPLVVVWLVLVSLVEEFWAESTAFIRRLLLDEAAGRSDGAAQFTFDIFGVVMDFSAETVLVIDALDVARPTQKVDLAEFCEVAASFGDSPSVGDGLTLLQRTRPTFEAGVSGVVGLEVSD